MKSKTQVFALSLVVGLCVEAGRQYLNTVREERIKREKIAQWQSEMLAVIQSARERVEPMLMDPNIPLEEGLKAWREEQQFINLVRDQPKY